MKRAEATLRDRFAMAALSAVLVGQWDSLEEVTARTYAIADAMLKARET